MFTKALSFIKTVLGSAGIFAPILAAFGVAIPPVAIAAVPLVVSLMTEAENALGDGTGPLKKAAVTNAANAFVDTMKTVSTGGQAETYQKFTPEIVDTLIDTIATVANGISKQTGGNPVFDDSEWEKIKGGQY